MPQPSTMGVPHARSRRAASALALTVLVVGALGLTGCLTVPGDLAGTVRNTAGAALEGIEVILFDGDGGVVASTSTDADGGYELAGVGPGYHFRLRLHDASGTYDDWWHAGAAGLATATPIAIGDGATTVVDATMVDPATDASIGGVVTLDGTTDPVAGLTVALLTPGTGRVLRTTTTGGDGRYLVVGLSPGDVLVRVGGPGYGTVFHDGARSVGTTTPIALVAGDEQLGVDVSVAVAGTIKGAVQDGSGGVSLRGGIPGLVVLAAVREDLAHPVAVTGTDATGAFTLRDLPPGELILAVVDPDGFGVLSGFAPATVGTPLEVDPTGAVGVEVHPGLVTDPGLITATGADCTADRFPGDNQAAVVSGVNLGGSRLAGCSFGFSGAAVGTSFAGADLERAFAALGDFRGADLSGARLTDATLVSVTFDGADFTGADARRATFTLFGTLMSTFADVDFSGADLTGAVFAGADLSTATFDDTTCPDGTNSDANGGTCVGHA